jgi:hypothetical protein
MVFLVLLVIFANTPVMPPTLSDISKAFTHAPETVTSALGAAVAGATEEKKKAGAISNGRSAERRMWSPKV